MLIFGGGVAGLWILDELSRRGYTALLLEAQALGAGQTAASQGILHGGLKYSLNGILSDSARAIRDMPSLWRSFLSGAREPNLTETFVRAEFCHVWRTDSIASRLGMIGARIGLRARPEPIANSERPVALRNCPGAVVRLPEQIIDPATLVRNLSSRWMDRIILLDANRRRQLQVNGAAVTADVFAGDRLVLLKSDRLILAAGAGNAALREELGLSSDAMQRRPLHMAMARGARLPPLYGHCVDGNRTRITVTSAIDSRGRTIWQIGGQIAEDGVRMDQREFVSRAVAETRDALSGFELRGVEWSSYRVDRAEGSTSGFSRPDDACVRNDGRVITAWPTKLVLAPRLARGVADLLGPPKRSVGSLDDLRSLPRPEVAPPPWEMESDWVESP